MSIHDFSHGPYDDYNPNWEIYVSGSSDDDDPNVYTCYDVYKIVKEYNKDFHEAEGRYASIDKLLTVIRILEKQLNIPEKDQWIPPVFNRSEFFGVYEEFDKKKICEEFHDDFEEAWNFVHDLDLKIDSLNDELFHIQQKYCDRTRELEAKAKVDLHNWGLIHAFLKEHGESM